MSESELERLARLILNPNLKKGRDSLRSLGSISESSHWAKERRDPRTFTPQERHEIDLIRRQIPNAKTLTEGIRLARRLTELTGK